MAAHLSNGRLNLGVLREISRKEWLECLDKCDGPKAIVWDEQLIGPFGLITEYAMLKEHNVTRMFPLRPGKLPQAKVDNVIFLTRANLLAMDTIADNVRQEDKLKDSQKKDFHLFFVPCKSLLCEKKLKELGVYGNFVNVEEINVELYPYDGDLLTMELDGAFHECHLEGDMTSMYHVAKSLMTLQALYGIIPHVYGKGPCARQVYDLIVRMRREMAGTEPNVASQIDALLLIDRSVDPLTPLVTQLTYEGLIDEIYGINSTIVKLPPEKFLKGDEAMTQDIASEPKQFALNSAEELFADLRDRNFSSVGNILVNRARIISAQYEAKTSLLMVDILRATINMTYLDTNFGNSNFDPLLKRSLKPLQMTKFNERHGAKTVSEIKQFVARLPHMETGKQSLAKHTSIAELIKERIDSDDFMDTLALEQEFTNAVDTDKSNPYIEECIAKKDPLIKVLRLICIQSFTNSGLKSKVLDQYKKDIIHTYGFEHILTLQNLEAVGLLRVQGQQTYQVLRKTLRLTVDEVNEQKPNDIAYVHSGYAPLSIRLAQFLARPGWRAITEALSKLPGPTIDETQQVPLGLRNRRSSGSSVSATEEQKVTLVFFLGGCTYSEIAALRFLALQEDYPTEYVIATTKVINGKSFLESIFERLV